MVSLFLMVTSVETKPSGWKEMLKRNVSRPQSRTERRTFKTTSNKPRDHWSLCVKSCVLLWKSPRTSLQHMWALWQSGHMEAPPQYKPHLDGEKQDSLFCSGLNLMCLSWSKTCGSIMLRKCDEETFRGWGKVQRTGTCWLKTSLKALRTSDWAGSTHSN